MSSIYRESAIEVQKANSFNFTDVKARIDNYTSWIDRSDGAEIKAEVEQVLSTAGFSILNFIEHHFEPQGYTAVWLLAESHCALHTFPEEDKSYIELSSCNVQMYIDFIRLFSAHFQLIDAK